MQDAIKFIKYDGRAKLLKKDFTNEDVNIICEEIINEFHNGFKEEGEKLGFGIYENNWFDCEIKFERCHYGSRIEWAIIKTSPEWMARIFLIDTRILFTKKAKEIVLFELKEELIYLSLAALGIKLGWGE